MFSKTMYLMIYRFTGHKNTQYRIENCFSNDDSIVLSGSEDGMIYAWDLVEAAVVEKIQAHRKSVLTLSYHPDEKKFISGSSEGTVIIWGDGSLS